MSSPAEETSEEKADTFIRQLEEAEPELREELTEDEQG